MVVPRFANDVLVVDLEVVCLVVLVGVVVVVVVRCRRLLPT